MKESAVKNKTEKKKTSIKGVKKRKTKEQKVILSSSKMISSKIISECDRNPSLILIGLYKRSALIVKIKTETIRKELCPNSMTPVETFEEITFFDAFIISWENKNKNNNVFANKDKELPIYRVDSEYGVINAIKNA